MGTIEQLRGSTVSPRRMLVAQISSSIVALLSVTALAQSQAVGIGSRDRTQPDHNSVEASGQPFWQPPADVQEIAYDATASFLQWPADVHPGEIAGVARNSKGSFFIYSRGDRTQLFEFSSGGGFLREIGKGLYGFDFGHSVRVDRDDNIWAVDEGSNMVIKFDPQGRVVMTLGRKWERVVGRPPNPEPDAPPPAARPNAFGRPTDVTWDTEGNIFVADGHNNSRIAKFSRDGSWMKSWGRRGSGPGEFNLPHTIASDSKGKIYVGDYMNSRIQVFDSDGHYLSVVTGVGHPGAICITPPPNELLFSGDGTGHFYKLDLNGKVLGWFGKWGKRVGEFNTISKIHCQSDTELYVGEIENWRVQRLTLKSPATHPSR